MGEAQFVTSDLADLGEEISIARHGLDSSEYVNTSAPVL